MMGREAERDRLAAHYLALGKVPVGLILVTIIVIAVGLVAYEQWNSRRVTEEDPWHVAEAYFAHLRDGEAERARALAVFEDKKAEAEWERQVQEYVQRREVGGRTWWGSPFKPSTIPDRSRFDGRMEVQWRFQTEEGWEMSEHHTYQMRRVGGRWRMVVGSETAVRGAPWVPSEEP